MGGSLDHYKVFYGFKPSITPSSHQSRPSTPKRTSRSNSPVQNEPTLPTEPVKVAVSKIEDKSPIVAVTGADTTEAV
jgi:hypothetical protein